jgi:hypothetical protein
MDAFKILASNDTDNVLTDWVIAPAVAAIRFTVLRDPMEPATLLTKLVVTELTKRLLMEALLAEMPFTRRLLICKAPPEL